MGSELYGPLNRRGLRGTWERYMRVADFGHQRGCFEPAGTSGTKGSKGGEELTIHSVSACTSVEGLLSLPLRSRAVTS